MQKTVEVEALETHQYAGLTRSKGSKYQAVAKDARVLSLIGKVKVLEEAGPEPEPPQKRYQRRDMRAQD